MQILYQLFSELDKDSAFEELRIQSISFELEDLCSISCSR